MLRIIRPIFLFVIPLFGVTPYFSQNLQHIWAKDEGGNDGLIRTDAGAIDGNNNLYVVGHFQGSQIPFGNMLFTSNPHHRFDTYVAKYEANGSLLWAKTFGGTQTDKFTDIEVDNDGFIIVTGYFNSPSISFDNITLTSNSSSHRTFLLKLDTLGAVIWVKATTGNGSATESKLGIDTHNNYYLAGDYTSGNVSFGNHQISGSSATHDMYLVKYDENGTDLWANSSSTPGGWSNFSRDIAIDQQNNVILSGTSSWNFVAFGNDTIWHDNLYFSFASKFSDNGTLLNSTTRDSLSYHQIAIDENNDYYVLFNDSIVKLNHNLDEIWKTEIYSTSNNQLHGIHKSMVSIKNNIFITGDFDKELFLQNQTLNPTPNNTWRLYKDVFLICLDTLGNEKWAKKYGYELSDEAEEIVPFIDNNKTSFYLLGQYSSSSIDFDLLSQQNNNTLNIIVFHGDTIYSRQPKIFLTKATEDLNIGINEYANHEVTIFPNPSSGIASIVGEKKIKQLKVFNTYGQMMKKVEDIDKPQYKLNLSLFPKGLYIVETKYDKYVVTFKLLIQ